MYIHSVEAFDWLFLYGKVTLSGNYRCKVRCADHKASGDYVIQAIFRLMFMHTRLMNNFLEFLVKSIKYLQLKNGY